MNDAELEKRVIEARPAIPLPPARAKEKARYAALSTVRRRSRRGLLIALAAALVLGALTVPAALGVGGSLLDLLPLGGKREEDQFRAACTATTVQIMFDPAKGAAVTSAGETLAFAGFGRHEIADGCRPLPAKRFASPYPDAAYEDLPDDGLYKTATVTCTVPGEVEINAHPIWDGTVGRVAGSVLLILRGDPARVLVSVVLKDPEPTASPGTSHVYFVPDACRKG
jgi:hypothetical protein